MNHFIVSEIVTTEGGRVILNGPRGSIEIKRQSSEHSSAVFHGTARFQQGRLERDEADHAELVKNIPEAIGTVPGSCAF
ncbi:MAG: hypothetical protein V3S78_00300 [Hyphomicrobium sp.]